MSLPVVIVGSANVDEVLFVDPLPNSGDTVFGQLAARTPGGKGLNQAIASHRAGANTRLVISLGEDENAKFLEDFLNEQGLPTQVHTDSNTPTGRALIAVDDLGNNQIVVLPGSNLNPSLGDSPLNGDSGYLVLQLEIGFEANLKLAEAARELGWKVVLTPAPVSQFRPELFGLVDILILNETEAKQILNISDIGDLENGSQWPIDLIIVTLGNRGCVVVQGDKPAVQYPAFEVEPKDTTGAGDTFCGYLVANLALGRSLSEAVQFATAAAAIAVQSLGAAGSIPDYPEVERMVGQVEPR